MSKSKALESFTPYVSPGSRMAELGVIPVFAGMILGIIFGASSLYLALKVGMTVSASIPIAVLSITLFRGFSKLFGVRQATILENNIVQTTGSAGESLAFGVSATIPALLILGFEMDLFRAMVVTILGGLLGIVMMIPLRRALVKESHGELPFPEGTACAMVLEAGEKGGTSARTVFQGFFVGVAFKICTSALGLWREVSDVPLKFLKGAVISLEGSPELMGVGFIIGPRYANLMAAGGVLSSLVLIPAIMLFGHLSTIPLYPATKLISEMSPYEIWRNYVLYIGAGAVTMAGIISLITNLPVIVRAARLGMTQIKIKGQGVVAKLERTDQDLSLKFVGFGVLGLVAVLWLIPSLHLNLLGAILIIVFGFLFVTVSSRLTGEIGSSSNPVSGMTVATLLITSLIFLALGWTSPLDRVAALGIAAVVCVAISNGGTTAQDLKTGFLVGATPRAQQIAIIFGALSSAIVIGWTLSLLNQASTVYSTRDLPSTRVPDVSQLHELSKLHGPEAKNDPNMYHVLRLADGETRADLPGVASGTYLVDDAGSIKYLVDPGINGKLRTRDDGSPVPKYDAPKARIMSLIIDGILARKLPWGLVLLGAFIVLALELCGISTLAFATGVYLPLSTSAPIFIGGLIRHFADRASKQKPEHSDSGPGVLLSSGLIAGGSIAGIGIALLALQENILQTLHFGPKLGAWTDSSTVSLVAFGLLGAYVFKVGTKQA